MKSTRRISDSRTGCQRAAPAVPAAGRTARSPRAKLPALVLAAFGGLACACSRAPSRPDVVLVTIDTLRADHCSSYGYPVPTTPSLDAVASGGVRYARAYAEVSTTSPSHAVLMTGRHFRTLGVTRNGDALPAEAVTLAEALHEAGYATAAFVSSFPLLGTFGFSQGFESYDDDFEAGETSVARRKPGNKPHDRQAEGTVTHVEKWLEARAKKNDDSRPLFLWVHFVDPHAPYRAPREFVADWPLGTTKAAQRYDGEVHYADEELGRLLKFLRSRGRPGREQLLVVTSDHGEGLGDHNWMTHGINLYEEAVRVPLVARWQGHLPEGQVAEDPVGIVDIAEGILAALGIDAPTFSDGRNLFAPGDPARAIHLQRREYISTQEKGRRIGGEMTAIVERGSKLIFTEGDLSRQLYNLVADPRERQNLLETPATVASATPTRPASGEKAAGEASRSLADELESELRAWRDKYPPAASSGQPIDDETRKTLRSLGYVD